MVILFQYGRKTIGEKKSKGSFDSISSIDRIKNHTINSFDNGGAMATTSLLFASNTNKQTFTRQIVDNMSAFAGRQLHVSNKIYRSEILHSEHNLAIAYLLKSYNKFYGDIDECVDVYIRQCSVMVTSKDVAIMAATLANDGVKSTDLIFTARTDANGSFIENTVADKTGQAATTGSTNTYKLSERWVQEFVAGDKRKDQNVITLASVGLFNTDRGNSFNTRYSLKYGGAGLTGVTIYSNNAIGANEITIAGTYEENELMKAEALIMTGQVDAGATAIDAVRTYQGAGLTALGAGLTQAAAYEQLRRERRIALAFRGLSFYDARRWDIIAPDKSRTGAVVVSSTGAVSTNATIVYGFLDYWDVPDNELAYNPAETGSAPTKNPKQ